MMLSSSPGVRVRWNRRIERAPELRDRHAAAATLLSFYERVLRFQCYVAEDFQTPAKCAFSLREEIDLGFAASKIPTLLALSTKHGPKELAHHAEELGHRNASSWRAILKAAAVSPEAFTGSPVDSFFARVCLQPIAETLQFQFPADANYFGSACPACSGVPQLSILRPEGEGASRWLLCSFCLREWRFRRIICPSCGEEDKEKLPRYSAPECGHVAVEACDACWKYLKSVDMTIDGRAEPLVDEAATAVLDLWAGDRGYAKIVKNAIGF
jgi:FdhE protein